ncbi:MAG: ABC transporter ATP-binding protein/permease, partial [Oscillospiraceae bacterium]|nr:ABC transporter ATP-binding protein/permease [Oscillospiraceae bacterium]
MTNVKKLFAFMLPYKYTYSLGIFLYNAQGFVFAIVIGLIGSNVMAGIMAGENEKIVTGLLMSMGILVVCFCLVGFGVYISDRVIQRATLDLKQKLFRSFVRNDLETSQSTHSGTGIAAINTDADTAIELWRDATTGLIRPTITVCFSIITILFVDWRIGLAAIGLGAVACFMQTRFVKPSARLGKERLEANANATSNISNISQGALSIRAFNLQDKSLEDSGEIMAQLKLICFKHSFISMCQRLFTTVQGWLALLIVFGFGGWLVATQGLEFSVLFLILPLVEGISNEMGGVGQGITEIQTPMVAAGRIMSIIENTPQTKEKGDMEFDGSALHIKDLSFKYQNTEDYALHNIDLDINVGEMVAFVGASGSGKSTMLKVIVGFYERDNLGITLGGTGSDSVSVNEWRKQFAYVDQSCKLFDVSVRENIALGRKGSVDDFDIKNAAVQAFAHDFIMELPEKYETSCGEKGASLSGGQKQRIAIARALIKGAPILVFDEATSSL